MDKEFLKKVCPWNLPTVWRNSVRAAKLVRNGTAEQSDIPGSSTLHFNPKHRARVPRIPLFPAINKGKNSQARGIPRSEFSK
jgi:hypothetical protein